MLTVVEKVIVLQGVHEFSEVSTEQLAYLAAIAKEVEFPEGARIYSEADASDAMYIVLAGSVRLHRGATEVTVATVEQAFGTWALFDDELRVVSATAREPTRLLRVDKDEFIEVLADNVDVTRGVLKAIVKRLRGLVERVSPGRG
jgi:CRP-like cAMP-binding protein